MAKYNLPNYTDADGLGFPKNFRRGNPNPLDNSSVWSSYGAALAYAQNDPVAYVGQILSVVDIDNGIVTAYSIQDEAGTLKEVGSAPVGDGKTIQVAENGTVSLYGIDTATDTTKKYQPVLVNGALTWQELSTTTVEGLDASIKTLSDTVDGIDERVGVIEGDYLTSSDKTTLESAISTAKSEAISEAVQQVLGESVDADFDTLQEVAAWIQSDTTSSTLLINRVSAIESDYLKGADKTALQGEIDALESLVGTLPNGSASTTVVAYVQEVVDGLKIGDYAKAADLIALADRVTAIETKLATVAEGAQVNVIDSVDTTQFSIANKNLTLLDIAMGKVTGLGDALAGKVDKVDGSRLITESEADKLEKLVIGDDGSVSISGTIAAGNVSGLADWITARAGTLKGLSENNFTDAFKTLLETVGENAEENIIEIVKVGGTALVINAEDKSVDIPVATASSLGVVKSTSEENGVSVSSDGTMSVNAVNVNTLTQTEGETLILNGGSSAN